MNPKALAFCLTILLAGVLCACSSQQRRLSRDEKQLPKALRNELRNFVQVPGQSFSSLIEADLREMDPLIRNKRRAILGFYLMRHEVSIAEYMEFCQWKKDTLNAPDTLTFVRDNIYTFDHGLYFWHPYYLQHPVVGVSYTQVCRFLKWKTDSLNARLKGSGYEVLFRLPSALELEGALGAYWDSKHDVYPSAKRYLDYNTGGQWTVEGELIRKNNEDGYPSIAPAHSMAPNDLGIYHLHGNVAEMTSTSYPEFVMNHADSVSWLNDSCLRRYTYPYPPRFSHDPKEMDTACFTPPQAELMRDTSLMVSKGGSWFHAPYYCRPQTILPFRRDTGHSWLGFRMVLEIRAL